MEWRQGEHVGVIGQNGSGKTYLLSKLLPLRQYVIVIRTKADDIRFTGFRRIRSIDGVAATHGRYLLDPPYERQRAEVHRCLEMAWKQGGWCVAVDELYYVGQRLKQEAGVERLLTQGRSLHVSTVIGVQRPSRVSRFALSEPNHIFSFRLEGRDVKTLAEATTPRIEAAMAQLGRYQFVYYNRLDGRIAIGDADHLERV